jgi:hypothetical protein
MNWLWDLITSFLPGFLPDLLPWLLGAIGAVGLFLTGRSSGKAKAKQKQAEAALDKTVKGQEAARKGRSEATDQLAKGKTPEEIVRQNDDKW